MGLIGACLKETFLARSTNIARRWGRRSISAMLSLPGPLLSGPLEAATGLWALTGEKRNTALAALRLESAEASREADVDRSKGRAGPMPAPGAMATSEAE